VNGSGEPERGNGIAISVVIPTCRRAASLRGTLNSLAADLETDAGSLERGTAEVLVVCDGEDAATRELSQDHRKLVAAGVPVEWIFLDQNQGLSAARNAGAARAQGELLLFLDDDMEAVPGLVRSHVEAHAHLREAGEGFHFAVCGRIREAARAPQATRTGRLLEEGWKRTLEYAEAARSEQEIVSIPLDAVETSCFGANCSIRRELFAEVGGFQPALREMDEEMELGCRLYLRGVRFRLEPGAEVLHRNDKEMVAYFRRCWRLGGRCDALRATELGERSAQTRRLLRMDSGAALAQMVNRMLWEFPEAAHRTAQLLHSWTERTGWRLSFRLWHDIERQTLYWEGAREAGCDRQELRELATNPVRVLMLHSIATPTDEREESYYLSPGRWRALLDSMKCEGYSCADPCKLEDIAAVWGTREFILTFDDGYDDFYTQVFPLMEAYGLRPLVFLPVEWIGKENCWDQANGLRPRRLLTLDQIRELQRHGVRFGSHTLSHPSLPGLAADALRREVGDSKQRLEDLLGEAVPFFAYPFGECNRRVRAAVIEAGYKMAFTTVEGLNLWQDPFAMRRTEFNDRVFMWNYNWKLRSGVEPRQQVKAELAPLWSSLPRELRRPISSAWRRWRGHGAPPES